MGAKPRPFRLTPPTISETTLQEHAAKTLDLLLLPPAFWCSYASGHIRLPPAAAAALMRAGLKRGIPDLLIFFGGRTYGIELKLPGAKLSKTRTARTKRGTLRLLVGQEDVHPRLIDAGMIIAICHSVDEILAQLRAWEIPLRLHSVATLAVFDLKPCRAAG